MGEMYFLGGHLPWKVVIEVVGLAITSAILFIVYVKRFPEPNQEEVVERP